MRNNQLMEEYMKHLVFVIMCYLMIFSACGGDSGGAEDNEAPAVV